MSDKTFRCAVCGSTFEEAWSEEEATAEMEQLWPGLKKEDSVVLCDDCFGGLKERAADHDLIGKPV